MKKIICRSAVFIGTVACLSCQHTSIPTTVGLVGTYRLIEATTIRGHDTTRTMIDSSKTEMIKIFNDAYFSFFNHDKFRGKDSTALFVSGAGKYKLDGTTYTEHLEYCTARAWEGRTFTFDLSVRGDTLIQEGREELPDQGVMQTIKEIYVKVK
ncbi:hypothetical protein [Sphingobacterium suaedae]|uniref:Lipocalin-like domain-containing protein n=1 Tax=Sphingobacterium suaedae TaxID=1686402 RepID=A0ABW5KF96_9SPHI